MFSSSVPIVAKQRLRYSSHGTSAIAAFNRASRPWTRLLTHGPSKWIVATGGDKGSNQVIPSVSTFCDTWRTMQKREWRTGDLLSEAEREIAVSYGGLLLVV